MLKYLKTLFNKSVKDDEFPNDVWEDSADNTQSNIETKVDTDKKTIADLVIFNAMSEEERIVYIKSLSNNEQIKFFSQSMALYHIIYIKYIENPLEELQLLILKKYGTGGLGNSVTGCNIQYINNPLESIILKAIEMSSSNIQYIKKPTKEAQLKAVKKDGKSIKYIKNPLKQVKLEAVKKNGNSIQYINNPSEEMQLEAVKQNGSSIQYIKNPSEEAQLRAYEQDWRNIKYVEFLCNSVQIIVVKRNIDNIELIQNPSDDARVYVEVKKKEIALRVDEILKINKILN